METHTPREAAPTDVDAAVREYTRKQGFDGAILVRRRGKRLYEKSFGVADRAFQIPFRRDTRFKIASITKAFTSVLVLQLCDQGRLDLDQPIAAYLPDYAGEGARKVLVRHLLSHTSGLPNIDQGLTSYDESRRRGIEHYQRVFTLDEMVRRFCSGKLVRPPGTGFDYNNADYLILGRIVETVTGKPFEQALQERLLEPLGLRDSGLLRQSRIVPRLAPTYIQPDGASALETEMPLYVENWYAAGAMYATSGDLMRFAEALFGGRLLKPDTLTRMLTPGLDDYGFGVWLATQTLPGDRKVRAVFRPGRILGANGVLFHILDDDTTILVLSNTNRTDLDAFPLQIARALPPA